MQTSLARGATILSALTIVAACILATSSAEAASGQLTAQQQAQARAQIKATARLEIEAEQRLNVGKTLPVDVTALNDQGQAVHLHDVLHGPAIVVKTHANCPPCEQIIDYLRAHGPNFARNHHVQIVVLNTAAHHMLGNPASGDPTGDKYPRDMPSPIIVLHVKDYGTEGFFGGKWVPTEFFFDKDLKLVARRITAKGGPAEWLQLPSTTTDPAP